MVVVVVEGGAEVLYRYLNGELLTQIDVNTLVVTYKPTIWDRKKSHRMSVYHSDHRTL